MRVLRPLRAINRIPSKKILYYSNSLINKCCRHENSGNVAAWHSANVGKCSTPLLLCILHIWNYWSSVVGWVTPPEMLYQWNISEPHVQRGIQRVRNDFRHIFTFLHYTLFDFSIPNLYYKLEEDDLMPDYICAAPNTFGMHKCTNLPYYKQDGKVTKTQHILKSLGRTFCKKFILLCR